jgi:hypothetical protein
MKTAAVTSTSAFAGDSETPKRRRHSDVLLYALLVAITVGAWWVSRLGYYKAGDNIGYWLGVAGGVMMLLLFTYPLRKYVRFTHRWGKVKWWFLVHMVLGIGGPVLILLHSTFHLRSVNATVAFLSMVVVALSGVVGRFLYIRIHRGLHGQRSNLQELQAKAGLAEGEMKSRFRFAPEVAERLLQFEQQALSHGSNWTALLGSVLWLPVRQRLVYDACVQDLNKRLRTVARERGWTKDMLRRRRHKAHALTRSYLVSVVRVSQFTAYERLFALWHVLHVPFVYLLVLTALFHVFAVHAY